MIVKLDNQFLRVCYKCFNKIAEELKETSPKVYKGKTLVIVKAETCEHCNKSNYIKI